MSVNSKMTAIADAIRAKTGGTGLLTLDDMAQDIAAIDTSENLDDVLDEQESLIDQIQAALEDKGVKPEQTKTATPSLSQQIISPDSGYTLSGVTVEPITSSLLTSLDPDFKPENIAKDANLFGLIGTHAAGAKIATGTVSGANKTITVSGLDFAPNHVFLMRKGGSIRVMLACYDGEATYYINADNNNATIPLTYTTDGFTLTVTSTAAYPSGDYYWVAWAD